MTGYRAFNKIFVKNIPVLSSKFEIETEMTLHALDKKFIIKEIPIIYRDRPEGSTSKLNTIRDGLRHIKLIVNERWTEQGDGPFVHEKWTKSPSPCS